MKTKIAIVHDFLREYGGGERVLEALHNLFPEAPIFTSFLDKKSLGSHWQRFSDWNIHLTWFSKIPFHKKIYSPLRFLAPKAFADLDLSEFDLVISSTNAFEAKAVKVPNGKQLCYCHTPPRALYGYSTMSAWKKNGVIRVGGELINHYMRVIDFRHAQQVDQFIANSEETQKRIKKLYRKDSVVIYPPVKIELSSQEVKKIKNSSKQEYYFYVNRLGLQKHPEIAVQACLELGLKLKVAGTGPMFSDLVKLADNSKNIELLGAVDDLQLAQLYTDAKALIYPVEDEDFGMVPIEAMMAGTPVIAHDSGGPSYTIKSKESGILFEDLSVGGLKKAIEEFGKSQFSSEKIIKQAEKYSVDQFNQRILSLIDSLK